MKITQIRNATLILEYAGMKFLIDPMLADKESMPGFPRTARPYSPKPSRCLTYIDKTTA